MPLLVLAIVFLGRGTQLFLSLNNQTQGEAAQASGDYDTALGYYQQAWHYNKNPLILSKIGILQYTQKNYVAAKVSAEAWINRSPSDPSAYQLLGRIYKAQNQLPAAKEQLTKADKLAPLTTPEIKLDLIETNYLLQDYDSVVTIAASYITLYDTQARPGLNANLGFQLADILDYQGQAYLALHDTTKACAAWSKALQENPDASAVQERLRVNCSDATTSF